MSGGKGGAGERAGCAAARAAGSGSFLWTGPEAKVTVRRGLWERLFLSFTEVRKVFQISEFCHQHALAVSGLSGPSAVTAVGSVTPTLGLQGPRAPGRAPVPCAEQRWDTLGTLGWVWGTGVGQCRAQLRGAGQSCRPGMPGRTRGMLWRGWGRAEPAWPGGAGAAAGGTGPSVEPWEGSHSGGAEGPLSPVPAAMSERRVVAPVPPSVASLRRRGHGPSTRPGVPCALLTAGAALGRSTRSCRSRCWWWSCWTRARPCWSVWRTAGTSPPR